MAHLMPMEVWAMTFCHLDYKDLRKCMLVSKFFQELAQDPKLRSTLFRGIVVSTLTSYYQFLVSLYLPQVEVAYPPEGGWPKITKENFLARYDKQRTDEVIQLARHMPFVQACDESDELPQIYPTVCCSGTGGYCPPAGDLPPSVFCFAEPEDGDGYYLILDVEQETITIYGSDGPFKVNPNSPYRPIQRTPISIEETERQRRSGELQEWRDEPTYRVPDFFEELKWRFREIIVQPSGHGTQVVFGTTEEKAILKKHSWPSSSYDKTACMNELKAHAAEQDSQ